MGGGSFRYDFATKQFTPVSQIDPEDLDLMLAAAKEKSGDLDNYIKAARQLDPVEFHKNKYIS